MSKMEELQEARYWAEEARRCARISVWLGDLSFALAVVGFALSAWCVFLKHSAVGEDGQGDRGKNEADGFLRSCVSMAGIIAKARRARNARKPRRSRRGTGQGGEG